MFNHVGVELQPITATTNNGIRLYETPEGNLYPSITTVLSIKNKKGLTEWRKKVGEDVAKYVSGKAAARGTKVHHMCEDYLNNMEFNYPDEWQKHEKRYLFHIKLFYINNIDKILTNTDKCTSKWCQTCVTKNGEKTT